jgi:preprotein translocase subunit SecG
LEGLVLFFHIVVCLLLVIIVLLQSGKSADLAGAFGGMGSQSTFGPRGSATFLSKMTTTLAILFMVTSLTLWIMAANKADSSSVLGKEDIPQEQTQTTDDKAAETKTADTTGDKPAEKTEPKEENKKADKTSEDAGKTQDEPKPAEPDSNKK